MLPPLRVSASLCAIRTVYTPRRRHARSCDMPLFDVTPRREEPDQDATLTLDMAQRPLPIIMSRAAIIMLRRGRFDDAHVIIRGRYY